MGTEPLTVNYGAIVVGAIASMIIGGVWYGPLFGRTWMKIIGVNPDSAEERKTMQKGVGLLYGIQFVLTLFQVLVLAHLIADTTRVGGIERSLWIWAAFVVPTLAGTIMWTSEKGGMKRLRFFIQGGYQLIVFVVYGVLLQLWK